MLGKARMTPCGSSRMPGSTPISQGCPMVLEQLLGAVPRSAFMENHFLCLPFSLPGGCRHLLPLGSWAMIDRVLACPRVDLLAGREGRSWDGQPPASLADA